MLLYGLSNKVFTGGESNHSINCTVQKLPPECLLSGGHNLTPDLCCGSVMFEVVMENSLYSELKRIGIDDELAAKVSASLDPDYNASKKDVLVMQEAIIQVQLQSERSYQALSTEISSLRSELHTEIAGVRSEMGSINRQYIITFFGLMTTIANVLTINWYYHL
ncbi:hypothetical protein GZ78_27400 [Endozoicomonas numazuensis]|uniref:Uncharacterized protein n=2 Tax=Endozoicomonas numazuensis TaxID=1137799 RepID=A0A081N153_9GAMM|nr:hypothetical protein GZ78_27400 [Endozoicomonas numazuensis]